MDSEWQPWDNRARVMDRLRRAVETVEDLRREVRAGLLSNHVSPAADF